MSSPHEHEDEGINLVWIIPPVMILVITLMGVFMWKTGGNETEKVYDTGHENIVPAASPASTGSHSR